MKLNKRLAGIIGGAILAGFLLGRGCTSGENDQVRKVESEQDTVKFWTCSMHPQIQQPDPGQCPICGMDLIPVREGQQANLSERELKLSDSARKLAGIVTVPVERKHVVNHVRMVGKVEYDETRLGYISAWVPGRIDRLFVDYTGVPVKKNDHMVYLYSPELLAAQEELIQTLKTIQNLENSDSSLIKNRAQQTIESSREKLRLLGLTENQVQEIERSGKPSDHVTIYSPMSGIVIEKQAVEGMYVQTGTRIYTIADLSHVWVKLDAYESDLAWIRYGQDVTFTTEAFQGDEIHGTVAFIDPVLNEKTRTIKVRVNVPNPDGKLKPGMFVRGNVSSRLAEGGHVVDPDIAGKYICPMHPEIIKDEPGLCDICEMDLVSTEEYGYVSQEKTVVPLVIPARAPLITGQRAVVYVELPGGNGIYEGRDVVLGPRAGDYYIVNSGLVEGEKVVSEGNFKIDSAVQILAKPSMMSPEGVSELEHNHGESRVQVDVPGDDQRKEAASSTAKRQEAPEAFQKQLEQFYGAYLSISAAMSKDNSEEFAQSLNDASEKLESIRMGLLKGVAHNQWMKQQIQMRQFLQQMTDSNTEEVRVAFSRLSQHLLQVIQLFGLADSNAVYVLKCPMALGGEGAEWLQNIPETHNPYFSGGMLKCGSVVEEIRP